MECEEITAANSVMYKSHLWEMIWGGRLSERLLSISSMSLASMIGYRLDNHLDPSFDHLLLHVNLFTGKRLRQNSGQHLHEFRPHRSSLPELVQVWFITENKNCFKTQPLLRFLPLIWMGKFVRTGNHDNVATRTV